MPAMSLPGSLGRTATDEMAITRPSPFGTTLALADDVAGEVSDSEETFAAGMRQNAMDFDTHAMRSDHALNFHEFCALIREREEGSHSTLTLEQRFNALDTNHSGTIEMHEFLMFSLKDALARSATQVLDLLKTWDTDGSGDISKPEFRRAIKALGFVTGCADSEIDAVFDEIDEDGSGALDYNELNRKVREAAGLQAVAKHKLRRTAGGRKGAVLGTGVKLDAAKLVPLDSTAGVSSAALAAELRRVLQANAVRVIDLFRQWDEDGDGTISRSEFARAVPALGIEAPEAVVDALFDSFDPDGSGEIEYTELGTLLRRQVRACAPSSRPWSGLGLRGWLPGVAGLVAWGCGVGCLGLRGWLPGVRQTARSLTFVIALRAASRRRRGPPDTAPCRASS
jgi:Ca2+-binding EF-hand superfamily protein